MPDRPYILITGFEQFGGADRNPSGELAVELAETNDLPAQVESAVLPVVFGKTGARMRALISDTTPDFVLMLGLAWGAERLCLERLGVNLFSGGPDNDGHRYDEETIARDAPAAYFSTLPVPTLVARLRDAGIPARESFTAGRYCCNEALFTALHHCAEQELPTQAGFVHVPRFPEQCKPGEKGGMARHVQRAGLRLILSTLLEPT